MKQITIMSLFIFLLSCSKEDIFTPIYQAGNMEYGWVSAQKNGHDFLASGWAIKLKDYSDSYFGIQFRTETIEGFEREFFGFSEIKLETGTYQVSGEHFTINQTPDDIIGASYGTSQLDGDVSEDNYQLNESKSNRLTVTEIDTINNMVKGTFQVWFKIDQSNREKVNPNNPDNVSLTNGSFELSFLN